MKVKGIKCRKCGDTIYSRTTHDYRKCSCGAVAVDGGFDYMKICGVDFEFASVDVDATKADLYQDWNKSADKFGRIGKTVGSSNGNENG